MMKIYSSARLRRSAISIRPVMAVPREQPDAPAISLNDQTIAVMFDFVNPVRPGWYTGGAGRDAGFE
jgi:hypothetical protein